MIGSIAALASWNSMTQTAKITSGRRRSRRGRLITRRCGRGSAVSLLIPPRAVSGSISPLSLIARDTVEEKVLELQAGKRQLADAVVRADRSLIRNLRREDLELLLS